MSTSIEDNVETIKNNVRAFLTKQGFIIDGAFEGDFETWVGVYARPKDKPTYLDPRDEVEAALQDKYSINGYKQDFSQWFEGKLDGTNLINFN